MSLLSETVGAPGVFSVLRALDRAPSRGMSGHALHALAARELGPESGDRIVDELISAALVLRDDHRYRLAAAGVRSYLLLEALNGGDIRDIFSRLGHLPDVPPMYELVRQGMTEKFLETLVMRPGFRRLYICSPWINLSRKGQACLMHAVHRAERRGQPLPEILVVTRPASIKDGSVPASTKSLVDLGATVFLHPRLHSKLYIREPGQEGGLLLAIVGSQNLTRSTNLELGIRINSDSHIINQLIRYFWEVSSYSEEA